MTKDRLLIFDLLRILAIILVLCGHIPSLGIRIGITDSYVIPFFGSLLISREGVILFIFISGAMLEYNKKNLSDLTSLVSFYIDKIIRIYPAYLASLAFAACFFSTIIMKQSLWDIVSEILGISGYTQVPLMSINPVGWFIGLLVVLYLLYPLLSSLIDRNPELWMITLVGFSLICRAIFWTYNEPGSIVNNYWYGNPLSNLGFFTLGIYVIRRKLYPAWTHSNKGITWLSELTFYIFLIQSPIIVYGVWDLSPILFIVCTLTVAAMLMAFDREMQSCLRRWINRSLHLDKKILIKSAVL
jgi:peptidoglycan/LPS O-acetylase OafA/YrhL